LLFHCLTGRPPFVGNTAEVYRHHLATAPDLGALPPVTPPSLRRVIADCLEKDPIRRPGNATALRAAVAQAQTELSFAQAASPSLPSREPKTLGPWLIEGRSPERPWTFLCRHESTSEAATVELHFSDELDLGVALRRAVSANPRLVELGAERLLGTSRFVLRPTEAWNERPEGDFQFWVARAPRQRPVAPPASTPETLRAAGWALHSMIELAKQEGLDLSLRAENIWLTEEGRVHVDRPGLPPFGQSDPYAEADAWLTAETERLEGRAPPAPPVVDRVAGSPPVAAGSVAASLPPAIEPPVSGAPAPSQPEVRAQTRPAGFGRRALAYLLDTVFVLVFWFVSLVPSYGIFSEDFVDRHLIWVLFFASYPVYHFAQAMTGATLGMRILGMRIGEMNTGATLTLGPALLRTLVLYIGSVLVLGCLWALWDPRRQTWHDKASRSLVVRK
jgi:uncharacterized RDD family membrane protein YckC